MLTLSLFLLLLQYCCSKTQFTSLKELKDILPRFNESLEEKVVQKEYTLVLFADESLINTADLKYVKQILKANIKFKENKIDLDFGYFEGTPTPEQKETLFLYPQGLPKLVLFHKSTKHFKIYKGGKGMYQILAWLKRVTRGKTTNHYKVNQLYQLGRRSTFLYYGEEGTPIHDFYLQNFWLKETTLPIMHLQNWTLLEEKNCRPDNSTADNFMLIIAKNATLGPCFARTFTDLDMVKNLTQMLIDDDKVGQVGTVKMFIDDMENTLVKRAKHYLYVSPNPDPLNFPAYEQFCEKGAKYPCYRTFEFTNRTMKYVGAFLNHPDESEMVYFVDNTELFPSKKYRIGDLQSRKQLLNFQEKIERGAWERFYASQKALDPERNGNNNVFIAVSTNYKEEIANFEGDVLMMVTNTDISKQTRQIEFFYRIAVEMKHVYPRVPVKFIVLDVFQNDVQEFEGMGTPRFVLYDYEKKHPLKINIYRDLELTMADLKKKLPIFQDPDTDL